MVSQFADCVFSIIDYGKTIDNDVKVASIDDVIRYVSSITGIQNELIKKIINEISLYKRDEIIFGGCFYRVRIIILYVIF